MHRIDGPGATAGNLFTSGNPGTGVPATQVTPEWLTAVQEEIANAITTLGLTLNKADNTQLVTAIKGTRSLANPGYAKLASGLIIQWGVGTTSASAGADSTHTFPIAFPTAVLAIALNTSYNAAAGGVASPPLVGAFAWTGLTGFSANNMSTLAAAITFNYIAVGY